MTPAPDITILVFTYKRPALLRRALTHVFNQTYKNFVVHIYDDCSDDDTSSVIADFQESFSNIKYICHPKNIGIVNSCFYAIQHVSTPYFFFVADDDFILPHFIQSHLNAFHAHPKIGLSICNKAMCFEDGELSCTPLKEGYYQSVDAATFALKYVQFLGAVMFRSEVLSKVQIRPEVGAIFDLDFLFRSTLHFSCFVTDKIVMCHQQTKSSITYQYANYLISESLKCQIKLCHSVLQEKDIQVAPFFIHLRNWAFASIRYLMLSDRWYILDKNEKKKIADSVESIIGIKNFFISRFYILCSDLKILQRCMRFLNKPRKKPFFYRKKKQILNVIRKIRRQPKKQEIIRIPRCLEEANTLLVPEEFKLIQQTLDTDFAHYDPKILS